jgi:hypothetical protein
MNVTLGRSYSGIAEEFGGHPLRQLRELCKTSSTVYKWFSPTGDKAHRVQVILFAGCCWLLQQHGQGWTAAAPSTAAVSSVLARTHAHTHTHTHAYKCMHAHTQNYMYGKLQRGLQRTLPYSMWSVVQCLGLQSVQIAAKISCKRAAPPLRCTCTKRAGQDRCGELAM